MKKKECLGFYLLFEEDGLVDWELSIVLSAKEEVTMKSAYGYKPRHCWVNFDRQGRHDIKLFLEKINQMLNPHDLRIYFVGNTLRWEPLTNSKRAEALVEA